MSAPAIRDTRSQILDAAQAVVMRDGVRNLTLDAVAAHAGGRPRRRHDRAVDRVVRRCVGRCRKGRQLSAWPLHRVALARALIMRPKILLLGEPLAALDLKLRQQMQEELRRIHEDIGGTFILVTHDQGEAFALANRVAVMNEGRIAQIGSPQEVYRRAASASTGGVNSCRRAPMAIAASQRAWCATSVWACPPRMSSRSSPATPDCRAVSGADRAAPASALSPAAGRPLRHRYRGRSQNRKGPHRTKTASPAIPVACGPGLRCAPEMKYSGRHAD